MYDAAGNFEKGTLTVTPVKAGLYLLTVGASVDFLTDENTVYPVYIDPTLTVNSGTDYIEDATIYEGMPTASYGTDTKLVVGTGSYSAEGHGSVFREDVDGNIIFDPELANRNVKTEGGLTELADYNIFVGYFAVVPVETLL